MAPLKQMMAAFVVVAPLVAAQTPAAAQSINDIPNTNLGNILQNTQGLRTYASAFLVGQTMEKLAAATSGTAKEALQNLLSQHIVTLQQDLAAYYGASAGNFTPGSGIIDADTAELLLRFSIETKTREFFYDTDVIIADKMTGPWHHLREAIRATDPGFFDARAAVLKRDDRKYALLSKTAELSDCIHGGITISRSFASDRIDELLAQPGHISGMFKGCADALKGVSADIAQEAQIGAIERRTRGHNDWCAIQKSTLAPLAGLQALTRKCLMLDL